MSVKEFLITNKAKVIGVIVVTIVLLGYYVVQLQPKSVLQDAKVSFEGYDGYGTASLDNASIHQNIQQIAYRKAGFSKNETKDIINTDPIMMSEIYSDIKKSQKYQKARIYIENVTYQLDKTDSLSNGDTVVLSLIPRSSQSPFKKEKKTFKVKGLKKVEVLSQEEFLKKHPVEISGFNGYGVIEIPKDDGYEIFKYSDDSDDSSVAYKNGDTVKLTLTDEYLQKLKTKGIKLENNTIEIKVSGLDEITNIKQLNDALSKNDSFVKSRFENTESSKYTIEKQSSYISYQTSSYDSKASGQIHLVSVYKITDSKTFFGDTETKVYYGYYGYSYYVKPDNTLDLETANKISSSTTQDLANLIANLETDGYKEYVSPE